MTDLMQRLEQHAAAYSLLGEKDLPALLRESAATLRSASEARPLIARALSEWHEDDGDVMWWAWCGHDWAGEPAWCGTPNDSDWPGYHTHWTPHPAQPVAARPQEASDA